MPKKGGWYLQNREKLRLLAFCLTRVFFYLKVQALIDVVMMVVSENGERR